MVGKLKAAEAKLARIKAWRDEQGGAESWGAAREPQVILAMFDAALQPKTEGAE